MDMFFFQCVFFVGFLYWFIFHGCVEGRLFVCSFVCVCLKRQGKGLLEDLMFHGVHGV